LKGICDVGGTAVPEAQSLFSKLGGADLLGDWLADVDIQLYCDNSTQAGEHVYFLFLGCAITCWSQAMMLSCLTAAKAQARLHSVMWKSGGRLAAIAMDAQKSDGSEEYRDTSRPSVSAKKGVELIKEAMRQHKLNQLAADNKAQKMEDESDSEKSDMSVREHMVRDLVRRAEDKKAPNKVGNSKSGKSGASTPRHSEASQSSKEDDLPPKRPASPLRPASPSNRPIPQLDLSRSNTFESEGQESDKRSRSPHGETRPRPRHSERRHSEDRPKVRKKVKEKPASDPSGDGRKSARPKKKEVHLEDSEQDAEKVGSSRREHGSQRPHRSRHDLTRAKISSVKAFEDGRSTRRTHRGHSPRA